MPDFLSLVSLLSGQVLRSANGWQAIGKYREEIVREKLDLFYFKIHSLDADSFYRIEITAHNAIGWSKPSHLVVRTAPGKQMRDVPFVLPRCPADRPIRENRASKITHHKKRRGEEGERETGGKKNAVRELQREAGVGRKERAQTDLRANMCRSCRNQSNFRSPSPST